MLNTNCLHTATAIIAEDKVTDFFRIANDLCKVFCIEGLSEDGCLHH